LLSQLIEFQAASFIDSSSDITVAGTVLAHKLRNGVNQLAFNVINAKIPSEAKYLMRLQVLLYLAFAKKTSGSIICSVCSIAYH